MNLWLPPPILPHKGAGVWQCLVHGCATNTNRAPSPLVGRAGEGAPRTQDSTQSSRSYSMRSTRCARDGPGSNGSAKYCVSRATLPPENSITLTV